MGGSSSSPTGVRKGDSRAPTPLAQGTASSPPPHFKEVDAAVKARGGCARSIMDDLAVAGHPDDVWPSLQRLEERLYEIVGLRKHLTKPSVFSRTGRYGNMPSAGYHVGTNGGGDTGLELGYGVVLVTRSSSASTLPWKLGVCVA